MSRLNHATKDRHNDLNPERDLARRKRTLKGRDNATYEIGDDALSQQALIDKVTKRFEISSGRVERAIEELLGRKLMMSADNQVLSLAVRFGRAATIDVDRSPYGAVEWSGYKSLRICCSGPTNLWLALKLSPEIPGLFSQLGRFDTRWIFSEYLLDLGP
ncbi:MAG TPA: hypothetical protein VJ302_33045 [Blastocatellia bacterium]|nr:hypothetical protein [Blastocatellia bacterium]